MARMDARTEHSAQPGARILMVDDDPGIRDVVSDFLGKHGYQVDTAGDAREMEQALERGPVDLIVLDIMLPGEDGLAICRRLAIGEGPPIIMLSAMGEDTDRVGAGCCAGPSPPQRRAAPGPVANSPAGVSTSCAANCARPRASW
jgi:two-component system OmpR family response regulator